MAGCAAFLLFQEFVLLPDDLLVHLVLAPVEDIDHRRNADGEQQQQQQLESALLADEVDFALAACSPAVRRRT